MKPNFTKKANYFIWLVIILVFVFLYFSYFFIFIPRQESHLQRRAFRILKEYGNNMYNKNKYFENHFKNYKAFYSIRYFKESKNISVRDSSEISSALQSKLKDVEDVIDNILPYVVSEPIKKDDFNSTSVFSNKEKKLIQYINEEPIKFDNFNLFYKVNKDTNNHYAAIDTLLELDLVPSVKNQVPIDKFMEGLKFDRLFENVILFDHSVVYYNSRLDFITDITDPKALRDSVEKAQGGIWRKTNIRGENKHIMVLPVDFKTERFYLAGVISDADYKTKTRTINNQFIILVAAFLLLVLIGMPILKIIYIDKNERLHATDASGSAISTIFGTGLLILITISIIKYQTDESTFLKNRIYNISEKLIENVNADIDSIKNLYLTISDSNSVKHTLSAKFAAKSLFEKESKKFRQYTGDTLKSPFPLNEIILIDSLGNASKAVTSTPFSEIVTLDLSDRQYFINAQDHEKAWPANNLKFYIESIKSYNTGQVETAISFHTSKFDTIPVLAVTSAIPSLYQQVLPKDIEYLIINNSGNVLYHSIKSKNLHENFLDECESDFRLKKAMELRDDKILQLNYNERKWMARIAPMKDTPLFHITLLDLDQNNNKNARILLFTFYFFLITVLVIGCGMLIMRWIIPYEEVTKNQPWFLIWLFYKPEKFIQYQKASFVLSVIIIIQFAGIWLIKKPFEALLYQLIFIIYASFVSMLFIKRKEFNFKELFFKKYLPENIFISTLLLLAVILICKFNSGWNVILPIGTLLIVTSFLIRMLKEGKNIHRVERKTNIEQPVKRIYLIYLFLWLSSLSVVPIIQYYFSIKNQEDLIWGQEQFFSIARENLEIYNKFYEFAGIPWLERIQGNGIDGLQVGFRSKEEFELSKSNEPDESINYSDLIYSNLPDPVTGGNGKNALIKNENYSAEWVLKDTSLFYTKGGSNGAVYVASNNKGNNKIPGLFIKIFIALILITVFLWFLLKYIASVLLNFKTEKWNITNTNWLEVLFLKPNEKMILLHTFNGEQFLKQSNQYISNIEKNKNSYFQTIKPLKCYQLTEPDFDYKQYVSQPGFVFWITGFEQFIHELKNHELFLARLSEIIHKTEGKIVIEIPFDKKFIYEIYEDQISEKEIEKEKAGQLKDLKKTWKLIFRNFVEYNGYQLNASENKDEENTGNILMLTKNNEIPFFRIWENLTRAEKIILYDLADDGLLNRKNTPLISHLINKKLIMPEPYPILFSEDFKTFITNNLTPSDIKAVESKLGLKSKWKNIRYLILLILVPLATLIFISQGISIERIFGIFAGTLTLITGILRLFDSQIFQQKTA